MQACQAVLDRVARGQDQHGQIGLVGACHGQQFHAVAIGQTEIQHQAVEGLCLQGRVGLGHAADMVHAQAVLAQPGHHCLADQLVIFHQQNTHSLAPSPSFQGADLRPVVLVPTQSHAASQGL